MYYKIQSFIDAMEDQSLTQPQIQNRTAYSPNDIITYLEGTMNLMYTDPGLTWENYSSKTDTFTISLSSGYASESQVEDLFNEVRDSASTHFYSITESNKFPEAYDAVILSQGLSGMTLRVTSRVGYHELDITPFGATDYWNVWGGKCGPYSGGSLSASNLIAGALDEYYEPYYCVFYTDIHEVKSDDLTQHGWSQANPSDPIPGDFIIDYNTYVFYCWDYYSYGDPEMWNCGIENGYPDCGDFDYQDISCLDPDEMNFYFQSIMEIYDNYIAAQNNTNIIPYSSSIEIDLVLCQETNEFWTASVYFGEPHSCLAEEYPLPLPTCCQ